MMEQSRRDDMECLANVMVYLKKAKLPWLRKLNANMSRRQRFEHLTKKKKESSLEDITEGLPEELKIFYDYCRKGIGFDERPNYGYLKGLLHSLIYKEQFTHLLCFQWQIPEDEKLGILQARLKEYRQQMLMEKKHSLVSMTSN